MLSADIVEKYFIELSKVCEEPEVVVLCGGTSLVLNYQFRNSTLDIDAVKLSLDLKRRAKVISQQFGFDEDFLNDDVTVTSSYTPKLLRYAEPYKTYGLLSVYTINGIALLCMKLKAMRPLSNDERDCRALIQQLRNMYSLDDVRATLKDIYGSNVQLSIDAENVLIGEYSQTWESLLCDDEVIESWSNMLMSNLLTIENVPKEVRVRLPYSCSEYNISAVDAMSYLNMDLLMYTDAKDIPIKELNIKI